MHEFELFSSLFFQSYYRAGGRLSQGNMAQASWEIFHKASGELIPPVCHPEHSEGSLAKLQEILRCQ